MNHICLLVGLPLILVLTCADSSKQTDSDNNQIAPVDNTVLGNFVSLCSRGRTHHIPATNANHGLEKIDSTTDEFIVSCTYKCLELFYRLQTTKGKRFFQQQEETANKIHYVSPSVENIKNWINRIAPQTKADCTTNKGRRQPGDDNNSSRCTGR